MASILESSAALIHGMGTFRLRELPGYVMTGRPSPLHDV